MDSIAINLAFLSYFIGFLFVLLIRSYDKYDREPLFRLFIFSVLGGVLSIVVSTILYFFVQVHYNFFDAIFKVGVVEEFSKLLSLFILYKLIKKEFDEIVDGIIYVAAVSLGFSVIENIFYALNDTHPYYLMLKRFIFATVGHISFSVYLGIAFYVHKVIHRNYQGLFLAFVLATLAHGLYDGVLFEKQWTSFFLIVYAALVYFQFRLLKLAYAYSQMKQQILVDNMKLISQDEMVFCCNCQEQMADKYRFNHIDIYVCQTCERVIIPENNFRKLLKYFRPKLERNLFIDELQSYKGIVSLNSRNTVLYHSQKNKLNANVADFNSWLFDENRKDINKYLRSFEGKIFNWLGFKYLKK
jgi:RsiW-degrading membrane proteinase PrsW (M82 family)